MLFPSKILMFGEYTILNNSLGLAIPYPLFEGQLKWSSQANFFDQELKSFSQYLKLLERDSVLNFDFDLKRFEFDVENGLIFESSIPMGYGLGSSGALCAALFDRYGHSSKEDDLNHLKLIFSKMESHFHGASSGVDPLISYLKKPLLLGPNKKILLVETPNFKTNDDLCFFLINTRRSRRTEPLVNHYLEKMKQEDFHQKCSDDLIPQTNRCIEYLLENNISDLYESFQKLSSFQFENFNPMIPKLLVEKWQKGLNEKSYYLKLCGAGGGGFFLGLTSNLTRVYDVFGEAQVRPIL